MTTDELKALEKVAKAEARRHLSKSGGHEVDDVAQVAIIEYLARTAKTEVKNPGAMIRMIAKRCAWKYRTKWKKRRDDFVFHHLGEADEVARADTANLGPDVPTPEDVLIARKEVELVEYAIDQLDPENREIARLTFLNQPPLKGPEVAERLNLAAGTVRNRLVQIRRFLVDLLGD